MTRRVVTRTAQSHSQVQHPPRERGFATVEYAIAGGLVVVSLVAVFPEIGAAAADKLDNLLQALLQ